MAYTLQYKVYAMAIAVLEDTALSDRWAAQMRKGALEMAALATLYNRRLYGLEIIRTLESESDLVLSEGTIYPILSRLKTEGLLSSEWVEAEAGHPRKYYVLTQAGVERLRAMANAWKSFANSLNRLLKPVVESGRKP